MVLLALIHGAAMAQDLPAYKLYNAKGKEVKFGHMVNDLSSRDVALFGEMHNNPICHWMQFEFARVAMDGKRSVVLGAEMFESDDQLVLNEYLAGTIKLDHLKKEAKVWPNFETDYEPLVHLAKDKKVPFIATNVPRRYASLVAKKGPEALDSLADQAKSLMGPLPYQVTENDSGYVEMREEMGFHGMGMNLDWLIAAQALKDHTMAHYILENLPGNGVFIHYNGAFHSQNGSGIVNYLRAANKDLNIGVITTVESESPELGFQDEWKSLGEYILVVPVNMTKTH